MKFALALCSAVAMGLAVLTLSHAQEPPPGYVPPDPALFSIPGGFRLAWAPVTGASRYAIRLGVTADDGTFIADDELANIDAGNRTFDIDAVLPHTEPLRCYTMRWRVYALIGTSAPEPPGEHSVRMCTQADNRSSFVNAPARAPASPSHVQLQPVGAAWKLVWRDNSADETAFKPGVVIVDPKGERVAAIELPQLPQDTTSIMLPPQLTSAAPADSCYGAIFLVFALAADGTASLPGSYATAICIRGTEFSFPDAGSGPAVVGNRRLTIRFAYMLEIAGTVLVGVAMFRLTRQR